MNPSHQSSLQALLRGEFELWRGLPRGTTIDTFLTDLYPSDPGGKSGRLSGRWLTYFDFSAATGLLPARIWCDEEQVVRIDLEHLSLSQNNEQLQQLGEPDKKRFPPVGLRFFEEDELKEYLYLERGLVLHVTDPTLPGGSGLARIIRVRAFEPMSEADYDRNLGGQQPGRSRHPNRIE